MDRRPTQLNKLARGQGTDRKTVFLLNLVDGPRALYAYRNERRHFFLSVDHGRPEAWTFHVRTVRQHGWQFRAAYEVYKHQLERAKTPRCRDQSTDDLEYTRRSLVRFVTACNGQGGTNLSAAMRVASGTRLDHAVGVSAGRGSSTHAVNVPSTSLSGTTVGLRYQLLLSRNRPAPQNVPPARHPPPSIASDRWG